MDDQLFSPTLIADALRTTKAEIAGTLGLGKDALSRVSRVRARKTQVRLRQMMELLNRVEAATGSPLAAYAWFRGEPLPGLNLGGAGRVVCLIDPVGDVYACPFVMHSEFKAGSVRDPGGFGEVWQRSALFAELRSPASAGACASCGQFDACRGGCMAAKFFTGIPLDGPDPECVNGHGTTALANATQTPLTQNDHSHRTPVKLLTRP